MLMPMVSHHQKVMLHLILIIMTEERQLWLSWCYQYHMTLKLMPVASHDQKVMYLWRFLVLLNSLHLNYWDFFNVLIKQNSDIRYWLTPQRLPESSNRQEFHVGITWYQCQCLWCHMTKEVMLHLISNSKSSITENMHNVNKHAEHH